MDAKRETEKCETDNLVKVLTITFKDNDKVFHVSLELLNKYPNSTLYLASHDLSEIIINDISYEEFVSMISVIEGKTYYNMDSKTAEHLHNYKFITKIDVRIMELHNMELRSGVNILSDIINGKVNCLFCNSVKNYRKYKLWLSEFLNIIPVQIIALNNVILKCSYNNVILKCSYNNGIPLIDDNDIKPQCRTTPNYIKFVNSLRAPCTTVGIIENDEWYSDVDLNPLSSADEIVYIKEITNLYRDCCDLVLGDYPKVLEFPITYNNNNYSDILKKNIETLALHEYAFIKSRKIKLKCIALNCPHHIRKNLNMYLGFVRI